MAGEIYHNASDGNIIANQGVESISSVRSDVIGGKKKKTQYDRAKNDEACAVKV